MKVLVDTNVLLRAAQLNHAQTQQALDAIAAITTRQDEPCIVPQVLLEFWVVATRTVADNGLGFSTLKTAAHIRSLRGTLSLLEDGLGLVDRWLQIVTQSDVKGKPAHDARLVAAMQMHGVTAILTFNVGDFGRLGVLVLQPSALAS